VESDRFIIFLDYLWLFATKNAQQPARRCGLLFKDSDANAVAVLQGVLPYCTSDKKYVNVQDAQLIRRFEFALILATHGAKFETGISYVPTTTHTYNIIRHESFDHGLRKDPYLHRP